MFHYSYYLCLSCLKVQVLEKHLFGQVCATGSLSAGVRADGGGEGMWVTGVME